MLRALPALLALIAAAMPAAVGAAAPPTPTPYEALAALEARIARIGYRLTTANAGWCPVVQPQLGILWGDRRLYSGDQWPQARQVYGASDADTPFVAAAAPDAPAARAGLTVGTAITGGDGGIAVPLDDDPFARIDAMERAIAAHNPTAEMRLTRSDGSAVAIVPVAGCASDFRVEAKDRPAGGADGRLVLISAGLASFATDDAELAAAVAHELAHNILRHRARLDAAGINRGLLKQFGRNARLIRQTEIEADRLSVWLIAGAGYDPHAAVRFWQAFGQRKGRPLFQAGTHPRWRDRVASVKAEILAIRAAQSAGEPLRPPLIADQAPLE